MNAAKQKKPEIKNEKHNKDKQKKAVVSANDDLQRVIVFPKRADPKQILRLQSEAGNTAVCRLVNGGIIQREPSGSNNLMSERISNEIQQARGSGVPLAPSLRQNLERDFNHDFTKVRIHTDHRADHLSQQISARAFTTGSDIFFRQNAFSPSTTKGEKTLRHELTHVVQQEGSTPAGRLRLGNPDSSQEHQAENAASHLGGSAQGSASSAGVIQRVLDYAGIASKFGVTEDKVRMWLKNVPEEKHIKVSQILTGGKAILANDFSLLMLRGNGVDVEQLKADCSGSLPQLTTTTTVQQSKPPVPPKPKNLQIGTKPPSPPQTTLLNQQPKPQTAPPIPKPNTAPPVPGLTEADVRTYVTQKAAEKNMPASSLLDIVREVGGGDLTKVTTQQIDQVIGYLETRDFNSLAAMHVSINKIVEFTSRFEVKGVGIDKLPDERGAVKKALLGGPGGRGKIGDTADFLQNSVLGYGVTGIGGVLSQPGMLETVFGRDIGTDAENGMALAGNITMSSVQALQSTGTFMQSGLDWASVHRSRRYHRSLSGGGIRQGSLQAVDRMLQGSLGMAQAGLGFGSAGTQFAGDKSTTNELNLAKSILGATSSGISVGTGITKASIAAYRGSTVRSIPYVPSPHLSSTGNSIERSIFPKLKAVLSETQSKKGKGTALDITGDLIKTMGGITKASGFAGGQTARTITSLVQLGTSIGVPVIKAIIDKVKGYRRDKAVEKAGFRNVQEFRLERMRNLETYSDQGKSTGTKSTFNVREVRDEVSRVFDDYDDQITKAGAPPTEEQQLNEKSSLSVSKLLSSTGSFADADAMLREKNSENRKKFIQNIILSRQVSY